MIVLTGMGVDTCFQRACHPQHWLDTLLGFFDKSPYSFFLYFNPSICVLSSENRLCCFGELSIYRYIYVYIYIYIYIYIFIIIYIYIL